MRRIPTTTVRWSFFFLLYYDSGVLFFIGIIFLLRYLIYFCQLYLVSNSRWLVSFCSYSTTIVWWFWKNIILLRIWYIDICVIIITFTIVEDRLDYIFCRSIRCCILLLLYYIILLFYLFIFLFMLYKCFRIL